MDEDTIVKMKLRNLIVAGRIEEADDLLDAVVGAAHLRIHCCRWWLIDSTSSNHLMLYDDEDQPLTLLEVIAARIDIFGGKPFVTFYQ